MDCVTNRIFKLPVPAIQNHRYVSVIEVTDDIFDFGIVKRVFCLKNNEFRR